MSNIQNLLDDIEKETFSIEIIESCKHYFRHAVYSEKEQELVKKYLKSQLKEYIEINAENAADVIVEEIKRGGIPIIKDILFYQDAIYIEEMRPKTWRSDETVKKYFIGSANGNFIFDMSDSCFLAFRNIKDYKLKEKARVFIKSFNGVYSKTYGFSIFSETEENNIYHEFISNKDIEEILEEMQHRQKVIFRSIDKSIKDNDYYVMEVEVNPSGETILKNVNKVLFTRLSDCIENKRKDENQILLNLKK